MGEVTVKFLECCFNCHKDLANEDWQVLIAYDHTVVLRCPHCKSVHNCSTDGTVVVYQQNRGGNNAYFAD